MNAHAAVEESALIDGVDVDAVAAAVANCPGVDGLDGGALGTAATYLPGRRVSGVQVGTQSIGVQVRTQWNVPIAEVVATIRDRLLPLVGGRTIDVTVSDIALPGDGEEHSSPQAAALEAPQPVAALPAPVDDQQPPPAAAIEPLTPPDSGNGQQR